MNKLLLLMAMLPFLLQPARAAEPVPARAPGSFLTGGVGTDERAELQSQRGNYSLHLSFALAGRGEYVAGVVVRIENVDRPRESWLFTDAGPLFFVRLAPGSYRVSATYHDATQTRQVRIGQGGTDLVFHWPRSGEDANGTMHLAANAAASGKSAAAPVDEAPRGLRPRSGPYRGPGPQAGFGPTQGRPYTAGWGRGPHGPGMGAGSGMDAGVRPDMMRGQGPRAGLLHGQGPGPMRAPESRGRAGDASPCLSGQTPPCAAPPATRTP